MTSIYYRNFLNLTRLFYVQKEKNPKLKIFTSLLFHGKKNEEI